METSFGIALFVAVYGRVAYIVYEELTGRRGSLIKKLLARRSRWPIARPRRRRRQSVLARGLEES